ncbi:alpha-L-fucosidase [Microbacterium esteraromaticum]|uniref:alpha-L-fucosidase n=1 Tax=Microbacterium esteraromaticum TaxID=57043 RepID=UPI001CD7453E|nr:alpha-L-fucosidase [Microbacterium esteraromaticum]MCA1306703.1 alpha-L-fucosidase [Microbacterium esteraromaticum]
MPISENTVGLHPSSAQLRWQQAGVAVFFHFGLNTFAGVEWSDGTLPAASFDPTALDARQWVAAARIAGAQHVVLTAKHHDGFCLWPTATTEYSVASSPWRGGDGDVVRELADACVEAEMGFGVYLSPWDRNATCYPDAAAYDDFYCAQLTELCTGYGDLVEVWFDGAGSAGREYDWARITGIVREQQPGAVIFNMGDPDIRWVGNEDGLASDPVLYVADWTPNDVHTDAVLGFAPRYLPPECDVSLRHGWFWHPFDEPKTVEHLLGIHYRSVGLGANLLLNVPPNRDGLIDRTDLAVLEEYSTELARRFGAPLEARIIRRDAGVWDAEFADEVEIDHLELAEALDAGQRVAAHRVLVDSDVVCEGGTIGVRRMHSFTERAVRRLRIETDGIDPVLRSVRAFRTGVAAAPDMPTVAEYRAPEADIIVM